MRILLFVLLAALATDVAEAQRRISRAPAMTRTVSGPSSQKIRLVGNITTTGISGNTGSSSFTLIPSQPHSFLRSLLFRERGDEPCFMQASFVHYTLGPDHEYEPSNGEQLDTRVDFRCGTNWMGTSSRQTMEQGVQSTTKRVRPPSAPTVDGYESHVAIHGLQVCTNDRNDRNIKLKGIKIFGTRLNPNGRGRVVRDASFSDQFTRSHCRKWETAQVCPSGEVGVGLDVYRRGDSITGLALRCQEVRMTRVDS